MPEAGSYSAPPSPSIRQPLLRIPELHQAELVKRPGHVPYFTFPSIEASGVAFCAFSTRLGGVSGAPFDSLNLGVTTRDGADNVRENRQRFSRALGYKLREFIRLEHGCQVHVLREARAEHDAFLPVADAVITRLRGVPITIYYADCVPVLLVDPITPAVGLVHAGWRGTVNEVVARTVEAMEAAFGSDPGRLLAGLGSSIGPCCMQVDEDVATVVREAFPQWQESIVGPFNKGTGKSMIDLWELNCLQLVRAGVPRRNVANSRLCTACRKDLFFSYRRDRRETGRLAMLVSLH